VDPAMAEQRPVQTSAIRYPGIGIANGSESLLKWIAARDPGTTLSQPSCKQPWRPSPNLRRK
jgi:hypothetical protein